MTLKDEDFDYITCELTTLMEIYYDVGYQRKFEELQKFLERIEGSGE